MTKVTENDIELYAIEELEDLGYTYIYGPTIAPETAESERTSFADVVLVNRLQNAINRINPTIPNSSKEDALKQVLRIGSPDLLTDNEAFHKMLTEGINVTYTKDGSQRGDLVRLVDFDEIENNEFNVINQFTVIENNHNKRPDVILFVNGLPLVVIELKNAVDENATTRSAYNQIQTYKATIPSLFTFNSIIIISDGTEAKAGSLSAGFTRFMAWKTTDGESEASHLVPQMETLIHGLLNKSTLLDLIRHFVVFEKSKKEDLKTGITTIETVKKIAAYHQFYAVNKAVESTKLASVENGDRKGGVVWHTQGSGKSLSMVFYSGKIVLNLNNPTILVITDRNDLDDQLFDTFASSTQLLRQKPVQAEDRQHLKELLKVASGGVVVQGDDYTICPNFKFRICAWVEGSILDILKNMFEASDPEGRDFNEIPVGTVADVLQTPANYTPTPVEVTLDGEEEPQSFILYRTEQNGANMKKIEEGDQIEVNESGGSFIYRQP